jgi:recombinational DNA repair protein RecR
MDQGATNSREFMQIKSCRICHTEHFNNGELCNFCTEEKHAAFELRLIDDSQPSWMVLSAKAVWGEREQPQRRWEIR